MFFVLTRHEGAIVFIRYFCSILLSYCADAVRSTYASASFRLCIFVCLSLVGVPESRVNRSSCFLGGGEVSSAEEV